MKIDRRSFLVGAGSLAAIAWSRVPFAQTAASDVDRLLIHADMEVDSITHYETYGDSTQMKLRASGNSPTISRERARVGGSSMKSYLNRNTSRVTFRTEVEAFNEAAKLQFRRTYWIGLSIFVPSDWQESTSGDVLFQVHNTPDDWANSKSPILAIVTQKEAANWKLANFYITRPEIEVPGNTGLITAFADTSQRISKGAWTDWVIEYRPDWRLVSDGGVGVTRIWKDGQKVVDYAGPNAYNENKGPYLKFGLYKSGWKDAAAVDTVSERTFYHDEIRVSKPDVGSFELVAPGADTGTVRPEAPRLSVS